MKDGPLIANVAALIGDPARANILTALMDGRALTASELAEAAGVTLQTASGHLSKLSDAQLLKAEKQGRHRYFRLSDEDVAQVLEALMGLAQRTGAVRVRTGPKDKALREARICYDHLAGESGVALLAAITASGLVTPGDDPVLTDRGRDFFSGFGIDVSPLEKARRPVCLHCLDWSERRHHLGGGLGASLLDAMQQRDWLRRGNGRVLTFTTKGEKAFNTTFGCTPA
ncbi:metalloregulator ArsR/SmtB family transcription factor [Agrobacterium tumefaciens]|uniref:metalloregulator ArsR/SmtB family transcription factor n=1 Tax=Agrobacterium tumefaciens TaxID=358 RepID=UPI00157728E2|nr:winged helix-turn-helix domain-containing protein [Agrobacterium tumefaciens]NTZ89453.1 metalloregulator ArsR/SmtB family transcription factor [Agrobacterium tumefaciens]